MHIRANAFVQDDNDWLEIVEIYDNYDFETKVLVASIRNQTHLVESALLGADVATIPFKVLEMLYKHPLTDRGLAQFLADWEATGKTFDD